MHPSTSVSLGDHDASVKVLLDALRAGEESGRPIPFDNEAFPKSMRARYARSSE
jgi:antitoxin ParD1/3/4